MRVCANVRSQILNTGWYEECLSNLIIVRSLINVLPFAPLEAVRDVVGRALLHLRPNFIPRFLDHKIE